MISAVAFTMERFREVLRAEREARVGGREKLADKTGINKTTIQNAEIGPDIPGIDTVARLVEGIGLTLPSFFEQIEALQAGTAEAQNLSTPNPHAEGVPDERLARLPSHAGTDVATEAVIDYLVGALLDARDAAKMRRSSPGDRLDEPGRSPGRVSHPRQHHRKASGRRRPRKP
jgi:transcriptional regulator with XRE-family HTH domain